MNPDSQPPTLSPAARTAWGKSHPQHSPEIEYWNPLWRHLRDSAAVAGRLWDSWLPRSVREQIADGAGGEHGGRTLLRFLAGTHDIGKATPAFAVQVKTLVDEMIKAGLATTTALPTRADLPHSLAGQVILESWLENHYDWDPGSSEAFASVIGGHHGIPPSRSTLIPYRDALTWHTGNTATPAQLLGTGPWQDVQHELLAYMANVVGADALLRGNAWRAIPQPVIALALGIVVVADWLASNSELFPLTPVTGDRPLAQPSEEDQQRLERAWTQVRLPRPWSPEDIGDTADHLLRSRFDLPETSHARPIQAAAVDAARQMDPHGLLIIEAPMGEGKTEAALIAAEILAARTGAGGVLVALPTQATSDAMFTRIMRWLAHQPPTTEGDALVPEHAGKCHHDDRHSVFLAHGKAWLNPDFTAVPRSTSVYDIDRDGDDDRHAARRTRTAAGGAYVDGWMVGPKKGVLADFVVSTIDHVLFGALQARHAALRQFALARKVVVLDEVHSFDAYMNIYLERAVQWLGAYGVPVVALSATLPDNLRDKLIRAYQQGREAAAGVRPRRSRHRRRSQSVDADSPAIAAVSARSSRLTCTHDGTPQVLEPAKSSRSRSVRLETSADDRVGSILTTALAEGGCALVVRNTVNRAQQTWRELSEALDCEVLLLHSRFLAADRKTREQRLVQLLGPSARGAERPRKLVVVATQVVEQSLDVDFDLLITDLAPTDLLLQRIGRLHRHDRAADERPEPVRTARAVIVGIDDSSVVPTFPRGSVAVYGKYLLLRAAAQVNDVVRGGGAISLPEDIAPLVQAAYGSGVLGSDTWQNAIKDARLTDEANRNAQQSAAKTFRLDPPKGPGHGLVDWLSSSVGEADVDGARAQVRDADDTFEVLVVQESPGGQWRLPDWLGSEFAGREVPMNEPPGTALQRALAMTALRLPANITRGRKGDDLIDYLEGFYRDAWQLSPALSGQLVLPLDDSGTASFEGSTIRYDVDTGLVVEAPSSTRADSTASGDAHE